jgi:dephospho-CoA kinase
MLNKEIVGLMQSNVNLKNMAQHIYIFGITGGTGAGKSTVSSLFANLGGVIIDVDKVGHAVLENEAFDSVVAHFGESILDLVEDNNKVKKVINRKKLGQIVFSCEDKLKALNSIVHPLITAKVYEMVSNATIGWFRQLGTVNVQAPPLVIAIDAALLFELHLQHICDYTILVTADAETRKNRIVQRDNISEEHALNRIKSQATLGFYRSVNIVDIVVSND